MSQVIDNSSVAIMQEQYSNFIVENLPEIMLPQGFTRNVSEFASGKELLIPTIGTVTLQDAAEGVPLDFRPIDTGRVNLTITEQVGDAWSVSDDLKEDGYLVNQLMAGRAAESARAIAEEFETKFLATCNSVQTSNGSNLVNGAMHRLTASGANRTMGLDDFRYMKYSFDKAKVRQAGRIAIVDPIVEMCLNGLMGTQWVSNNPQFSGIITEGFAQDHKFVANIFGFDIYTSNLLPTVGVEGSLKDWDGTTKASVAGDVANVFMSVADEQSVPIMHAMRRQPSVSGWRDNEERKDKYQVTTRYGFGAQRLDTLATIITSSTDFV